MGIILSWDVNKPDSPIAYNKIYDKIFKEESPWKKNQKLI